MIRRATASLRDDDGTITILLTGVLVILLMVMALGVSITGVHLERNALQYAADGAALAASQSVDESALYSGEAGAVTTPADAREAAEEFLRQYPLETSRTRDVRVAEVSVDPDGTVTVQLEGVTDPPLVGWFTRGAGISVPLDATGEARAR